MVVQHNLQAANTNRQLGIVSNAASKSTEKLSSGYKINRAADDAAGLSISEKMRCQVRGLDKASANASDGISLVQTAEGALNEVHSILQRMNELATQAANDTNTTVDRSAIKAEIDELASEIDRVASTTQFNSMNLLDGSFLGKNLQVGALSGQRIELNIRAMDAHGLGLSFPYQPVGMTRKEGIENLKRLLESKVSIDNIESDDEKINNAYYGGGSYIDGTNPREKNMYTDGDNHLWVDTFETAGLTMKVIQNSIDVVSEMRSRLGATQNRLEHTIANLDTTSENTSAAESRIRDTDMAKEMVTYSKNNILQQVGQSMLAQANQSTQGVLSVLG
ncbi:MAG: flagellin [Lachnospiraceae bacterium]|nr:flagellin [Lachnospiraceae bacterium]